MTPVSQTEFCGPHSTGNCWAACIASMLDLPLADVPDLRGKADGEWYDLTVKFLRSKGMTIDISGGRTRRPEGGFRFAPPPPGEGPLIASGESPRGASGGHSIIVDRSGAMLHDPHPSGDGICGHPWDYWEIIPLPPLS